MISLDRIAHSEPHDVEADTQTMEVIPGRRRYVPRSSYLPSIETRANDPEPATLSQRP